MKSPFSPLHSMLDRRIEYFATTNDRKTVGLDIGRLQSDHDDEARATHTVTAKLRTVADDSSDVF